MEYGDEMDDPMDNYDDIRSYVSKFCPSVWDQLFILAQTEIILLD